MRHGKEVQKYFPIYTSIFEDSLQLEDGTMGGEYEL